MLCGFFLFPYGAGAADFRFSPRPNKAHLIQWRPWNQATLEEARTRNRLILLSLSAVWCHWCHVMDETTYSDDAVINFINDNYIPVRVDADLRPDIDALYNQGGWPSTAILTPQGEVISGGNYIPPDEMLGRLKRAAALFATERKSIAGRIEELKVMKELRESEQEGSANAPGQGVLDTIVQILKSSFDEKNGGFGQGQKFPSPDSIDFLLSLYAKSKDDGIKRIVTTTLDRMSEGELFDKVEGGFFRYATKPDWSEPHYEKMLDVNAGLVGTYAKAALLLHRKDYLRIVRTTVDYVSAHLYDATTGAFFGSQDADEAYYRMQDRQGRKAPFVDKTAYADSSSLMISALVESSGAASDRQYLDMAVKSANFLLAKLYSPGDGMFHYYRDGAARVKGLLSDNALAGSAFLDLYNVTGDKRYLNAAQTIGALIIGRFYDAGMRRFRTSLDTSIKKPITAGVLSHMNENLANFRAIRFLGRLAYAGDLKKLKEVRDAAAGSFSSEYQRIAPQAAIYGNAVLWIVSEPIQITILADGDHVRKYLNEIGKIYVPEKTIQVLSLSKNAGEIAKRAYALKESVYLCAGKRCSKPISDPNKLGNELREFLGRTPGR